MIMINLSILNILLVSFTGVYSVPKVEPKSDSGGKTIEFTCSEDLAPGEILAWWQTKDIWTDKSLVYKDFLPLKNDTVNFRVRASNDVYFGFMSQNKAESPYIDIILAGWNKLKNSIALNRGYKIYTEIDYIVNPYEFRGFWARKYGEVVSIGFEGESNPFMSWTSTKKFDATHLSIATGWGSTGVWRIEGYSWPHDDILLAITQSSDDKPLNSVELPLKKSRSSLDSETTVYCSRHRMLYDGTLSQGVESKRKELVKSEVIPSGEMYVKVGPMQKVKFDENSRHKFTCSGSAPIDGRELIWFRKDHYRDPVSLETQNYDQTTNTNNIELQLLRSFDQSQLFCAQGYQYPIKYGGETIMKNYGKIVKSENITLVMKRSQQIVNQMPESNDTAVPCTSGQEHAVIWPIMVVAAVISTSVASF
ncbi:uncharacterized protein LOC125238635 [Leguminivora glycinivorella]|uniref:uncharacterized protein LOC125238635 n=1 Tax=Leguminivora glycinivorella TaxID=1035111 RepID=UPI00200CB5C5|nr:uncharacterized protein LOC125238635 [Leguminivora glycinivorella]